MKKTNVIWVSVLIIILSSVPFNLFSQDLENPQNDQLRIGFGIGFGQTNIIDGGNNLSSLILPIDFTNFSVVFRQEAYRIEPTLGYFSSSYSSDNSESSSSNIRLGSVFALANSVGSMNYYYGIDLGVVLSSSSDDSKTDFYIGPVTGGEYMFSDNFSLGGEIQLNYISIGQYGENNSNISQSYISTKGLIILRWYVQ